jgi:hypothetical protein
MDAKTLEPYDVLGSSVIVYYTDFTYLGLMFLDLRWCLEIISMLLGRLACVSAFKPYMNFESSCPLC